MTDVELQDEGSRDQYKAARITILGFAGSLRQGSYNKLLLKAASKLLPASMQLEIFDLDAIPPGSISLPRSREGLQTKDRSSRCTPNLHTRVQPFLSRCFEERD